MAKDCIKEAGFAPGENIHPPSSSVHKVWKYELKNEVDDEHELQDYERWDQQKFCFLRFMMKYFHRCICPERAEECTE